MNQTPVLIVVDSDFMADAIVDAPKVVAAIDVARGVRLVGKPFLSREQLEEFACGAQQHGSEIVRRMRRASVEAFGEEAPLALVRGADDNGDIIRTTWNGDGEIASAGWTEGYLDAVAVCSERGLTTVANFSFGGYSHMGTRGWERHRLTSVTGAGRPGHIAVAAAGHGDGRAIHSSLVLNPGHDTTIDVLQPKDAEFNLWVRGGTNWTLEVYRDGRLDQRHDGPSIQPNRPWSETDQELKFTVRGGGMTYLRLVAPDTTAGTSMQVDCYIVSGEARFHNWVDAHCVAEPANLPEVISVGLVDGKYSAGQGNLDGKPDFLVRGDGPISFRIYEVVIEAARIMRQAPESDSDMVRAELRQRFGGKIVA